MKINFLNRKLKEETKIKAGSNRLVILSFSFFLAFFLFISLVSAIPPQKSIAVDGLDIRTGIPEYVRLGTTQDFHIHVFNSSNGVPIVTGTTCYLHIYNSTGNHIYDGMDSVVSHTFDYGFTVTPTNLTNLERYQYITQCNNTFGAGGYFSGTFTVIPESQSLGIGFYILVILLAYAIAFIGFFGKNEIITILGGMFMMLLGLWLVMNGITDYRTSLTNTVSIITLALGAIFAIWGSIGLLGDDN